MVLAKKTEKEVEKEAQDSTITMELQQDSNDETI